MSKPKPPARGTPSRGTRGARGSPAAPPGQSESAPPDPSAGRARRLCLPVASFVGALGVDDETAGPRVNRRERGLRFGQRSVAVGEHPRAHSHSLGVKPGHQRRRELQFGGDPVGRLDVQRAARASAAEPASDCALAPAGSWLTHSAVPAIGFDDAAPAAAGGAIRERAPPAKPPATAPIARGHCDLRIVELVDVAHDAAAGRGANAAGLDSTRSRRVAAVARAAPRRRGRGRQPWACARGPERAARRRSRPGCPRAR